MEKKKGKEQKKEDKEFFFIAVTINLLLNISLIKLQEMFTTNVKILK